MVGRLKAESLKKKYNKPGCKMQKRQEHTGGGVGVGGI
jgi:hypothetical protein